MLKHVFKNAGPLVLVALLLLLLLSACNTQDMAVSHTAPASTATVVPTTTSSPVPDAVPSGASMSTKMPLPVTSMPPPTATPAPQIYVVRTGDSLTYIAERFSTTSAAIQIANGLFDADSIIAGQELLIPRAPAATPDGSQAATGSMSPTRGVLQNRFLCPAEEEALPEGAQLVGRSAVCRLPILSYRLGQGDTPLILVGGMHGGYEWNTILLAREMHAYLAGHADLIPPELSIYLIPNANPDSLYAVTGSSGSFDPPQNFAATIPGRFNGHSVDLNRNWDCEWQPAAAWGETAVSGGAAPFSEPETQALRDYFLERDPKLVLFWHSAAVGVYPAGCQEIDPQSKLLAEIYGSYAGYGVYDEFEPYEITGDAGNWLASVGIPSITVELTTHASLDWNKNLAGLRALMYYFAHTGSQ